MHHYNLPVAVHWNVDKKKKKKTLNMTWSSMGTTQSLNTAVMNEMMRMAQTQNKQLHNDHNSVRNGSWTAVTEKIIQQTNEPDIHKHFIPYWGGQPSRKCLYRHSEAYGGEKRQFRSHTEGTVWSRQGKLWCFVSLMIQFPPEENMIWSQSYNLDI